MTRNNADFEGVTYGHAPGIYGEMHIVAEHPDPKKGRLGSMHLSSDGYVRDIQVRKEYRRKGIATGMWRYAQAQGFDPKHSDSRTKKGDRWAESTGDYVPDNNGIYNQDAPNVWGE